MGQNMADDDNAQQRKVYMLDKQLVDRLTNFQRENNLPSEVDAVRHLLDVGLKLLDTDKTIVWSVLDLVKYRAVSPRNAAGTALNGHPKVNWIRFGDTEVVFALNSGMVYRIHEDGQAEMQFGNDLANGWQEYDADAIAPLLQKSRKKPST